MVALAQVLLREPRRAVALASLLGYPFSAGIQLAAARLLSLLSRASGRLAALLIESGSLPRLRADCAQLITDGCDKAREMRDDGESEEGCREAVEAAQEMIAFLAAALQQPAPNCAQLLLLEQPAGLSALTQQQGSGCLASLVALAAQPAEAHAPTLRTREHLLQLLVALSADSAAAQQLLPLLAQPELFAPEQQLRSAALEPLPAGAAPRAAALACRAHVIHLLTQLLYAGSGSGAQEAARQRTASALLGALFEPPQQQAQQQAGALFQQPCSCALELLRLALSPPPSGADDDMGIAHPAELRARQQELRVPQLLSSGTMRVVTERGDAAFVVPALHEALLQECRRLAAAAGGALPPSREAALEEAVRATLREVAGQNAAIAETSARGSLVAAWAQLLGLAVAAHQQGALTEALGAAGARAALQETALETLQAVAVLGDRHLGCPAQLLLCRTAHVLVASLADGAPAALDGAAAGAGSSNEAAAAPQLHATLRTLLRALQRGERGDARRSQLYSALLAYLQVCKPWVCSFACVQPSSRVASTVLVLCLNLVGLCMVILGGCFHHWISSRWTHLGRGRRLAGVRDGGRQRRARGRGERSGGQPCGWQLRPAAAGGGPDAGGASSRCGRGL